MTCSAGAALALALAAALAAADAPPTQAPSGRYVLDPARSTLATRIPLFGVARYNLRFTRLQGGFAYDPAVWRATRVTIDVDPRSVEPQSAIARRVVSDLDPDRHPRIRFVSTGVHGDAAGPTQLHGQLSMRGVTRPIVLDVAFEDARPGPDGRPRMSFEGSGRFQRSQFGLRAGRPFAGDEVDLVFNVEFVRE